MLSQKLLMKQQLAPDPAILKYNTSVFQIQTRLLNE